MQSTNIKSWILCPLNEEYPIQITTGKQCKILNHQSTRRCPNDFLLLQETISRQNLFCLNVLIFLKTWISQNTRTPFTQVFKSLTRGANLACSWLQHILCNLFEKIKKLSLFLPVYCKVLFFSFKVLSRVGFQPKLKFSHLKKKKFGVYFKFKNENFRNIPVNAIKFMASSKISFFILQTIITALLFRWNRR